MSYVQLKYSWPFVLTYYEENGDDPTFIIDNIKFRKMKNLAGHLKVFTKHNYNFGGLLGCIFIDVGANNADSTLFAASNPDVTKVYAYEPFTQVYNLAKTNISLNPELEQKIELYNYGWSGKEEVIDTFETDSIEDSSVNSVDLDFLAATPRERNRILSIKMQQASVELKKIIDKHPNNPIVLKLDIEGLEYKCFTELSSSGILDKVDVIFIEWHLKGYKYLATLLERNNFMWFNENLDEYAGLIRAVRRK